VLFGIPLLLFAYVVYRAATLSLTYDEAYTYLTYVHQPDVFSLLNFGAANNHFLYTILMKAFVSGFGTQEIVLRLPSILSLAVFLIFTVRFIQRNLDGSLWIPAIVLLSFNPYFLDFFSLARGYGPALCCEAVSLYLLLEAWPDWNTKTAGRRVFQSSIAGALAVLFNFTFLIFFVVATMVVVARNFPLSVQAAGGFSPGLFFRPLKRAGWLIAAGGLIVIVLFSGLVKSYDLISGKQLAEPVTVEIQGAHLHPAAMSVEQVTPRGTTSSFSFNSGNGTWVSGQTYLQSIAIGINPGELDNISLVRVSVGSRVVTYSLADLKARWHMTAGTATTTFTSPASLAGGGSRLPPLRNVINWRGDVPFVVAVLKFSTFALLATIGLGVFFLAMAWWTTARKNEEPRVLTSPLWVSWILAGVVVSPLLLLSSNHLLTYGGTAGFWQDTVVPLARNTLYDEPAATALLPWLLAAMVLLLGAAIARSLIGREHRLQRPGSLVLILLLAIGSLEIIQHFALHTPYLLSRTALLYLPLFALMTVLLLQGFSKPSSRLRIWMAVAGWVLAATAAAHFVVTFNRPWVLEWRFDSATKQYLGDVSAIREANGRATTLGVDTRYSESLRYELMQHPLNSLEVVTLEDPLTSELDRLAPQCDFLYLDQAQVSQAEGLHFGMVKQYSGAGTALLRKEN
jgi:hypothetical protein